jgi:hypothetical protein
MPIEPWGLAAEWLTGLGTIAVAVLAIWGDRVRSWFISPKLHVELNEAKGDLTKTVNGTKARYYHLRVSNTGNAAAANCRVILRDIQRKDQTGQFHPVQYVPLQLTWTPGWLPIFAQNISKDAVADFGFPW